MLQEDVSPLWLQHPRNLLGFVTAIHYILIQYITRLQISATDQTYNWVRSTRVLSFNPGVSQHHLRVLDAAHHQGSHHCVEVSSWEGQIFSHALHSAEVNSSRRTFQDQMLLSWQTSIITFISKQSKKPHNKLLFFPVLFPVGFGHLLSSPTQTEYSIYIYTLLVKSLYHLSHGCSLESSESWENVFKLRNQHDDQ